MWNPVQRPARRSASASVARATRGQDQQEGEIGGRLVEHARRVADRDAELRGGGHVDVVVAHRDVRHDPQPRRTGAQHLGVDPVGEDAHDGVDLAGEADQLVGGVGLVSGTLHQFVPGGEERIESAGGQLTGDEDTGHGRRA